MIAIVVMSLVSSQMVAQTLYVGTGGGFFAKTGVNIYINGDTKVDGQVDNDAGTIIMTGNLEVPGTWTSIGTEKFSGTGNQTIQSAITGTNYLGYLIKNNVGKIILVGDVDCDSVNFATDGLLDASNTILKVKNGLPTAVKGYSALRYIDVDDNLGILSRNISSTSTYVFPIGNSVAGYRRFDMLMTSLGTTGTSFLNGKLLNGSPGGISFNKLYSTGFSGTFPSNCTPGSNAQHVDFECLAPNYWNFSGPSDYRFTTLAHGSPCIPSGTGPRRVVKTPAGTGFWTANIEPSIVGTITDQLCLYSDWTASATAIPGGTYQGFGDFAIAGTFGAPLPVELLQFNVNPVDNRYLRITWSTASELNNRGFFLERSTNASNGWTDISWVPGNGNSNTLRYYGYDDRAVYYDTVYYYRLRQVDFDGTFTYSWINSGKLTGTMPLEFSFTPNPTNGIVTLYHRNNANITLYDVLGRVVKTIPLTENQFDISDLANGTYYLKVVDTSNHTETFKVVKI